MASPIGLFGGTFDPVHFGHLRLAAELREAFRLDRVVFLPAGHPWQRSRDTYAGGAERVRMLELAIAGEPAFRVDDREVRREGPSYTVDTLEEYRREAGPQAPLVFLCGTDAFARVETGAAHPLLPLRYFRRRTFVVKAVADRHLPKAGARELYEETTPQLSPEQLEAQRLERLLAPRRDAGAGKLSRRERDDRSRLRGF